MPLPLANEAFPPLPGQIGGGAAHLTERGAFTGMVFCPWKKSQIAVMRCAEWRAGCGHADSCETRPSDAGLSGKKFFDEVEAVRRAAESRRRYPQLRSRLESIVKTARFGSCQCVCGCQKPAIYKRRRLCEPCYHMSRYVHRAEGFVRRHG